MVKKILKKIKKFFKVKIYLNFPPKKNILLYDEIHSSILKNILKQDFNILKTREIELNLWIFLKQIIFFDFKFQTYTKNYIRFVDPKVIITFNDRKYQFYKLKKTFQNIIFISVQNGVHIPNFFKNKELIDSKNLKCDHFFVINKFYINKFNKFIKSKYHVLGRFTNNAVKVKKKIISNSFLLISQFDKSDSYLNDFYKKLLETLSVYFTKSNKKLYILLRSKDLFLQEEEKEFYKKFFKFNCVFKKCNNWKRSYEIVDRFENIIFMHSTLGYEAISRKKKVAIFSPKKIGNLNYWFGWPSKFKKNYNFFSSTNPNYSEVYRVLKNVNNCSQTDWKKYYLTIKDQLSFNKNNIKLKKVIINSLK